MNWYYAQDNTQHGPVDDDAFRQLIAQGVVTAYTLVWHEGMPNWQQLFQAAPDLCAAPPPFGAGGDKTSWPEELKGPGVPFAALKERAKNGPKGNYWVYAGYMVLSQVINLSIRWGFGLIALIPAVAVTVAAGGTSGSLSPVRITSAAFMTRARPIAPAGWFSA